MKGWTVRASYKKLGSQATLTFPHWGLGFHTQFTANHEMFALMLSLTLVLELELQFWWTRDYRQADTQPDYCGSCGSESLTPTIGRRTEQGRQLTYRYQVCNDCHAATTSMRDVKWNMEQVDALERALKRDAFYAYMKAMLGRLKFWG